MYSTVKQMTEGDWANYLLTILNEGVMSISGDVTT